MSPANPSGTRPSGNDMTLFERQSLFYTITLQFPYPSINFSFADKFVLEPFISP